MTPTITISVSINPVSSKDTSGGTVNVRIPRHDPDVTIRTAAELRATAVDRACKRLYGRNACWVADNGLPGYGQVMRPYGGGLTAITYRAALSVRLPDLGDEHRAAVRRREMDEARFEAAFYA